MASGGSDGAPLRTGTEGRCVFTPKHSQVQHVRTGCCMAALRLQRYLAPLAAEVFAYHELTSCSLVPILANALSCQVWEEIC